MILILIRLKYNRNIRRYYIKVISVRSKNKKVTRTNSKLLSISLIFHRSRLTKIVSRVTIQASKEIYHRYLIKNRTGLNDLMMKHISI